MLSNFRNANRSSFNRSSRKGPFDKEEEGSPGPGSYSMIGDFGLYGSKKGRYRSVKKFRAKNF